ncbi:polyprenol monophosphomannose synthase [Frigoribacterium sp. CG_9.8]|uniref:polyprenol monophosphomannose synthase n=1 Tax=Frigoribacterium sp. CG_9.8 TaxID=2787733 RepID=UPI0018C97892|nr:dolichol-phosphate mannosyltransferase [Frigoribacterium sp. CG_9.8]
MAEALIILPTYNEIESLEMILGRIRQSVPQADVLVVDDSSPDGTGRLADQLAATDPGLSVLHRAEKDGLGRAYLAGFAHALDNGYLYVIEMDADGSHDPSVLPAMLSLAAGDADLVIGSRWVSGGSVRNWPWIRQVISRAGNVYCRIVLRSNIHDITAGFRVYRADALRWLDLSAVSSQGYCFQVELAWRLERAGKIVVEHPIVFIERAAGRSKMHAGIVLEALLRVTLWGIFGLRSAMTK